MTKRNVIERQKQPRITMQIRVVRKNLSVSLKIVSKITDMILFNTRYRITRKSPMPHINYMYFVKNRKKELNSITFLYFFCLVRFGPFVICYAVMHIFNRILFLRHLIIYIFIIRLSFSFFSNYLSGVTIDVELAVDTFAGTITSRILNVLEPTALFVGGVAVAAHPSLSIKLSSLIK